MSDDGSSSGEEEYEIEKILHHKYTNAGGYQYFVRWKGYGPADDCWTSAKGFSAPELEAAYWESKNKKSVTPRSSASGSVDRYARNKPGTSRREKSQESSVKRSATRRVRTYKESPTDDDYSSGSDMRAGSDSPRPKRVRQKYRGAIPTNMGRSFEEQEDEDDGKGNISTSGSQTRAGSGIFSSLGSPPAQEMDAFNCFERKVFVPKYSPPYEMTPEPEAPISDYVEATNVKIEPDTNIIQEEPVFDPNKAIEIFKREREEPIAQEQIDLISEKTEKGPDVQNSNGSDIDKDADSDLEWDDRRNTLPAPPKQEGTAHEESKTILSDVFKSGGIRDPNNVLIERLVEVHTGSPSNLERKHWLRRVEVKIPEDVWRDDYWIGMSPIDISDAYNIHCNKLIANQCFLEDNNERQRLEYIYKKRHIEKLVLTWKLLNVDHINMEKIPTKILAVVSETFTNPETNQTFRKYYGVVAFWKCPGVAQQILWSELCDKCPKIVNQFRLDYREHKKMMNGFKPIAPHINDVNRFWMDENRRFGYHFY